MKPFLHMPFIAIIFMQGCDLREREESLQQKESALNEKEQQLILKEKSLEIIEEELAKRKLALDSALISDTTVKVNPALVGIWSIQ
jgi:hypothetical protein